MLQVSQRLTEYGVHFHRVLPEKRSQTGIMLGVYSKGALIFEVLNANRTPVLRFPWRDTKKISFTVRTVGLTWGWRLKISFTVRTVGLTWGWRLRKMGHVEEV